MGKALDEKIAELSPEKQEQIRQRYREIERDRENYLLGHREALEAVLSMIKDAERLGLNYGELYEEVERFNSSMSSSLRNREKDGDKK